MGGPDMVAPAGNWTLVIQPAVQSLKWPSYYPGSNKCVTKWKSHKRIYEPAHLYVLQPGNKPRPTYMEFSGNKQTSDCNDILSLSSSTHCTAWINEINIVFRKTGTSLYFCTNYAMLTAGSCADTRTAKWQDRVQQLQWQKTRKINKSAEWTIGGCRP
jgi:hypothetical protein